MPVQPAKPAIDAAPSADDAVASASGVLATDPLALPEPPEASPHPLPAVWSAALDATLDSRLTDVQLSVRTAECLEHAGIRTLRELVIKTEDELLCLRNCGRKSIRELRNVLAPMGLSLGMTLPATDAT